MPSAEIAITLEGFTGNPNGLIRYSFEATGIRVSMCGALAEALDASGANARDRITELEAAATDVRVGIDMLCVALRDDRPTPYPDRENILARLKALAEIANRAVPRSPLRAALPQEPR